MKDFLEKLNWVTVLGVLVAVEMQIGSGSMSISHMFPAAWIPGIQEAMGDLGSIGALIMSAGAFGRMPGVPTSGQSPIPPAIVKILIAAFLLSTFLFVPPAMAKDHRAKHHDETIIVMQAGGKNDPLRALNDRIKQDVAGKVISDIQDKTNPASNALQELADFISGDVANAADLAISIPDMLDGNGQVCLDEMKKASTVFQANPVPSVTEKQGLASALERIRLLAMTANRICQLPACTQVFADASGALAQLAPLKMPAVPNVHDICALIPTVAVAKPTRTLPTAAASPAATPATPADK